MTTNKNPELSGLIIPVIKIADEGNGDSLIITFLDPVGIGMIFPEDQGGKFLFGQIAGFSRLTKYSWRLFVRYISSSLSGILLSVMISASMVNVSVAYLFRESRLTSVLFRPQLKST